MARYKPDWAGDESDLDFTGRGGRVVRAGFRTAITTP